MTLRINGARLWDSLMSLAEIGRTPKGGVCRLTLTELDRQARERFIAWARAADCTIEIDAIGNIFARRAGRVNDLPPVVTGSHLDSQPTGGRFDGAYGVMAGLEVLRTLHERGIVTERPIEVVSWTNEEGSRFTPVMMGSGVYAGVFKLEDALRQVDREGVTVERALGDIGFAGDARRLGRPIGSYFEAHIEQGPVLEDARTTIGVVTGGLGLRWYDVVATGQDSHAGPTPMPLRRDALLFASEIALEIERIARVHHGRGTVGYAKVAPNSRNVVPGKVDFTVDLRHADEATLDRMEADFRAACARVSGARRVEFKIDVVSAYPVARFDAGCVRAVRDAASALALSHMDIVSGAGHDAVYMARIAPTAMVFVPCEGGISHNEIENARAEHLEAGCNVLLAAMLARAAH